MDDERDRAAPKGKIRPAIGVMMTMERDYGALAVAEVTGTVDPLVVKRGMPSARSADRRLDRVGSE